MGLAKYYYTVVAYKITQRYLNNKNYSWKYKMEFSLLTLLLLIPLHICSAPNFATNCLLCVTLTTSLLLSFTVNVVTNPFDSNNTTLLPSNPTATILFCNKISCNKQQTDKQMNVIYTPQLTSNSRNFSFNLCGLLFGNTQTHPRRSQ